MRFVLALWIWAWVCAAKASASVPAELYDSTPSAQLILAHHATGINPDHHRARRNSAPVLAYVTPWNPSGRDIVESFRSRLDIVSPVWYTIQRKSAGNYVVSGAPPHPEDEAWYARIHSPSDDGDLPVLNVTPRFFLDGWTRDDFRALVSNEGESEALADVIVDEVERRAYDGAVFESGATLAFREPLQYLATRLHAVGKTLTVVLPPLRPVDVLHLPPEQRMQASNQARRQAELTQNMVRALRDQVDYFSIMTYDYTGPGGQPVQQGLLAGRGSTPGPNSPLEWIESNVENLSSPLDDWRGVDALFDEQDGERGAKFLMGLALYGYAYPVLWADPATSMPVPRDFPRASSTDMDVEDLEEEERLEGLLPVLVGPGEAVTSSRLHELLETHDPLIRVDTESAENVFDYKEEGDQGRTWRIYFPSAATMRARLRRLDQVGAGVALWEAGQADAWILSTL